MPGSLDQDLAELEALNSPDKPAAESSSFVEDAAHSINAFGAHLVKGIPGGEWAVDKLTGALSGASGADIEKFKAQQTAEHSTAAGVGDIGAIGLSAASSAAMPGTIAKNAAAKAAVSAGQMALATGAYKLGDAADQAVLKSADPMRVEQIGAALFNWDTLKAAGLGALLGAPGILAESAGPTIQNMAKRQAIKSAGKYYKESASELQLPLGGELSVGEIALDKDLLRHRNKITSMRDQAERKMFDLVKKAPLDIRFRENLSYVLEDAIEKNRYNINLKSQLRHLSQQAGIIEHEAVNGPKIQTIIQGLLEKGKGEGQGAQLYRDVAHEMRDTLAKRIGIVNQEFEQGYRAAANDHDMYSTIMKDTLRAVEDQATKKDLLGAGAKVAAGLAARKVLGPHGGALADLAAGGLGLQTFSSLNKKSYANLLNQFSKAPPYATYVRRTNQLFKMLTGPSSAFMAEQESKQSPDERYGEISHVLRTSTANPDSMAQNLRSSLSFLPQHEADALTANTVNKLQESLLQLPVNKGPTTAFGFQTEPTDFEKREFLRKFDAKFDPYGAIASGRQDLILEAEKHNPEIMRAIKGKLIDELSSRKDIPYSTKRRVSAILGVAGVPMQDASLGADLQQIIQSKRQAASQAGQMQSARQQNAMLKNNQATLTRAQKLAEV